MRFESCIVRVAGGSYNSQFDNSEYPKKNPSGMHQEFCLPAPSLWNQSPQSNPFSSPRRRRSGRSARREHLWGDATRGSAPPAAPSPPPRPRSRRLTPIGARAGRTRRRTRDGGCVGRCRALPGPNFTGSLSTLSQPRRTSTSVTGASARESEREEEREAARA